MQLLQVGKPGVRRASRSVMSSRSTWSTASMDTRPAVVRSVPPALTVGWRHLLKASVTFPAATPLSVSCLMSTSLTHLIGKDMGTIYGRRIRTTSMAVPSSHPEVSANAPSTITSSSGCSPRRSPSSEYT